MGWLRRAWSWLALALGSGVVALMWLWRGAVRRAIAAESREAAAKASAARERKVADAVRVIEASADERRRNIELAREMRGEAGETKADELRAEVAETGSAADEVNRRMDARGER